MPSNYITKNQMPEVVDSIYAPLITNWEKVINCAVCGKVKVPFSYIVYKYGGKEFCSWNHKMKYKKAHPEEEK